MNSNVNSVLRGFRLSSDGSILGFVCWKLLVDIARFLGDFEGGKPKTSYLGCICVSPKCDSVKLSIKLVAGNF